MMKMMLATQLMGSVGIGTIGPSMLSTAGFISNDEAAGQLEDLKQSSIGPTDFGVG